MLFCPNHNSVFINSVYDDDCMKTDHKLSQPLGEFDNYVFDAAQETVDIMAL